MLSHKEGFWLQGTLKSTAKWRLAANLALQHVCNDAALGEGGIRCLGKLLIRESPENYALSRLTAKPIDTVL